MFTTAYPPQQVNNIFASYLTSEGFEPKTIDGENIWKKGVGLLTAPQCIKLSYQNNVYILEAWLKFAILPGVYVSEMDLDGFIGCIPKSILKSKVDYILMKLQARFIQPAVKMQGMYYNNPNIPPQAQGNPYANQSVPQAQGNPYANQSVPQAQGNPYANQNVPQAQGNPYANQSVPQAQGNPYTNQSVPPQVQGNPYINSNGQNVK